MYIYTISMGLFAISSCGTSEYSLGIFGYNFTFDDERHQRIANARNFYWTISTYNSTNVKVMKNGSS